MTAREGRGGDADNDWEMAEVMTRIRTWMITRITTQIKTRIKTRIQTQIKTRITTRIMTRMPAGTGRARPRLSEASLIVPRRH